MTSCSKSATSACALSVPSSGPDPAAARRPPSPDLTGLPGQGPVLLAFSGGADSVCLLHHSRQLLHDRGLQAIHVDHGLDHGSAKRARRALELAAGLGVDCQVDRVQVRRSGSIEANARDARYAALADRLAPDGVLMTAHQADDVAETMILRLVRGAGPAGLAGIPRLRRFAGGWLLRPLLDWTRRRILDYLAEHQLDWIRDPANELMAMDRNFVRHEIMPLLHSRFPGAVHGLVRSARLNQGAQESLSALANADVQSLGLPGKRLDLSRLAQLHAYRRSEAIRHWILALGHSPPPGIRLDEFLRQIERAGSDRQPELRWEDAIVRRYNNRLWLADIGETADLPWQIAWDGARPLDLPGPGGRLELTGRGPGLRLLARSGQTGEKLRLAGHGGRRRVKELMSERGIPPWQRPMWPRIHYQDRLVAVGNRWMDAEFARLLDRLGRRLVWESDLFGC
ncbi:MAG: tRNA lysidine(34) synthetase TilS [Wenzhouxiangella sp.]|nr:MAG: tRNA lysidine(34) synthetase TilS [Wenzhouxiangella sp.]